MPYFNELIERGKVIYAYTNVTIRVCACVFDLFYRCTSRRMNNKIFFNSKVLNYLIIQFNHSSSKVGFSNSQRGLILRTHSVTLFPWQYLSSRTLVTLHFAVFARRFCSPRLNRNDHFRCTRSAFNDRRDVRMFGTWTLVHGCRWSREQRFSGYISTDFYQRFHGSTWRAERRGRRFGQVLGKFRLRIVSYTRVRTRACPPASRDHVSRGPLSLARKGRKQR